MQIPNFEIGAVRASWFVSLLERLHELSKLEREDVLNDFNVRDALRIHDIDWVAKNIPIGRKDIDWVDPVYWENPAEFPLIQFHISRAIGRVAGFLDEHGVFNVVLLDPMHNLQPSKFNGYEIKPTRLLQCELTSLTVRMETTINSIDITPETKDELLNALRENRRSEKGVVVYMPISDAHLKAFDAYTSLANCSEPTDELMATIDQMFDRLKD